MSRRRAKTPEGDYVEFDVDDGIDDEEREGAGVTEVYLVYRGEYDERDVESVHLTLESAQASHNLGHEPEWSAAEDPNYIWCRYHSRHHQAQVPVELVWRTGRVKVEDGVAVLPDGRRVESDSDWVSYPIPPDPSAFVPERSWTEACDFAISVRSAVGSAVPEGPDPSN